MICDDSNYAVNLICESTTDIGQDLQPGQIDSSVVMEKIVLNDEEYFNTVQKLNCRQKEIFLYVLHNLKRKAPQPMHLFISGGAGVGKSLLIGAIHQAAIKYYNKKPGKNPSKISVLLTAFTGKAAFNISGVTLHSVFCLPVSQYSRAMARLDSETLNKLCVTMSDLKLLIIDEISMVGSKLFNQVNQRLQEIIGSNKPFGGINVILVGDFYQLSPVADKFAFQNQVSCDNPYSVLIGNPLWEIFVFFELTEIMRQKEDKVFANALNRMARGDMSESDVNLFKNLQTTLIRVVPNNAIHLFSTNAEVDNFNSVKLSTMNTEEYVSSAFDTANGDASPSVKNRILAQVVSLKTADTYGLPYRLLLKVGARYMMTNNVNTQDGLVNGATGKLRKIDYGTTLKGEKIPIKIWIQFDDPCVGRATRLLNNGSAQTSNKPDEYNLLTPVEKIVRSFCRRNRQTNVSVSRKQFPVVVSEAITVHKSQGDTYSEVVLHLNKARHMRRSQLYVGCSRARNANGLYLEGEFNPPKAPIANDPVELEMARLKHEKPIHIIFLEKPVSIYYHNVQSLNCHLNDVLNDDMVSNADFLLFVETWAKECDYANLFIPGFTRLNSICSEANRRTAYGSALYAKSIQTSFFENKVIPAVAGHLERMSCQLQTSDFNINIILVYKSPRLNLGLLLQDLGDLLKHYDNSTPTVIVGDFNVNYLENSEFSKTIFQNLDFTLMPGLMNRESTDMHTQLDLAFGNAQFCSMFDAHYRESYYSYHKSICFIRI